MRADDVRRIPVHAIGAPAPATTTLPAALGALRRLNRRRCRRARGTRRARRARVAAAPLRLPARHLVVAAAAEALRARGTNRSADAGAQVQTGDAAVLRRRVDDVGILGIVARLEAVATGHDVPVARAHAEPAHVARRTAEGEVVLRPAADVVERLGVVDREAVELRDGQVREETPRRALVVRFVEPAVVAEQDVVAVRRIELDRVMVHVHAGALDRRRLPGLPTVGAPLDVDVHRPDPVGAIRVHENLVVVLRAAAAIAIVGRHVAATAGLGRLLFLFFLFFVSSRDLDGRHGSAHHVAAAGRSTGCSRRRRRAERPTRCRWRRCRSIGVSAAPASTSRAATPAADQAPDPRPRIAAIV